MFSDSNSMKTHNEALYNQEVFEVFIAAGKDTPKAYLEIEINPNAAVWLGKIQNESPGLEALKTEMLDPLASNINFEVSNEGSLFAGFLEIPWKLISEDMHETYRINFFRIRTFVSHKDPNWVGTAADCDYISWSPTYSGAEPAFHRPAYFGVLHLT
jgi:methionine-rich copper-binding protein CopC